MVTPAQALDWDPSSPAPGGLEPLRRLANTLDHYRGRDTLGDVALAEATLAGLGLLGPGERLAPDDLERVRAFRAAVRSVFVEDEALGSPWPGPGLRVVVGGVGQVDLEPTAAGLAGRLADLAVELVVARRTGQLARLKACANPGCRWLFWDASRPGTGRWCSMQVCGDQHKARSYRARQRRQP